MVLIRRFFNKYGMLWLLVIGKPQPTLGHLELSSSTTHAEHFLVLVVIMCPLASSYPTHSGYQGLELILGLSVSV